MLGERRQLALERLDVEELLLAQDDLRPLDAQEGARLVELADSLYILSEVKQESR